MPSEPTSEGAVLNGDDENSGDPSGAGALAGEERLNSSLSEFEFHSRTEAEPVLDVGECIVARALSTMATSGGEVGRAGTSPLRRVLLSRTMDSDIRCGLGAA